jgi:hypothetical protein
VAGRTARVGRPADLLEQLLRVVRPGRCRLHRREPSHSRMVASRWPFDARARAASGGPAIGERVVCNQLRAWRPQRCWLSRLECRRTPRVRTAGLRDRAANAATWQSRRVVGWKVSGSRVRYCASVGATPLEHRGSRLCDTAHRDDDGIVLPADDVRKRPRRSVRQLERVADRSCGVMRRGHGLQGVDGYRPGDGR